MTPLEAIAGWKGYAATAMAALALGGFAGAWTTHRLADRAKIVQLTHTLRVERKAQAASDKVAARAEAAQVHIRTVTKTLIEKVPVYVTAETDARFAVPNGYVRLWNDAAAGRLPGAPPASGWADDRASAVTFSHLGAVTVETLGGCNATRQQLLDLQDWERTQAADR